jgi:D-glycero-alpha-D-manno-heptose-7-phosphate kinase
MERVQSADQVEHPIVREALRLVSMSGRSLEIVSMADIPAGTGLGSSGSFTTALLKALHTYKKSIIHPRDLAEQACHIEIDRLGEQVGKQDQYIAAFGGLTVFEFLPDGSVKAEPLVVSTETMFNLEDNLLLFFTGYSRAASEILQDQNQRTLERDEDVERNLHELKDMARESRRALEAGDLSGFAQSLSAQWEHKKRRTRTVTNPDIDQWHRLGMTSGAMGGKLIGAGGGGFLMFYAEDKVHLRHALYEAGLREVRFRFDFEGTKIVSQ